MERLHDWILSLPWVVERPRIPELPDLRWFAVDCEELQRRRVWLLTGSLDGATGDQLTVHVVVPNAARRVIADVGAGMAVAYVAADYELLSLRLDTTEPDHGIVLGQMLLLAYEESLR
jgi:ABC-type antimicrobial peptide transport system permease subunit